MTMRTALQNEAPNFVKATSLESISALLDVVRTWLVKANAMPTKDEVLKYVDEAFDTYIGPMFKRPFLRAISNELLLVAVGELYDSLAGDA